MRSFLLAATFVVAMAPAAFAGHADKDGPFAHANDNQIGTSTPYPGSPVVKEDKDGQITANFTTTWPAETYAISQTHPDPVAGQKVKNSTTAQR